MNETLFYEPIPPTFALVCGVLLLWISAFLYTLIRYGAKPALLFIVLTLTLAVAILIIAL